MTQYRTFALKRGQVLYEGIPDKRDTLTRDRINTAVQEGLSEKGLQPTNLNPDLIVTYTAAERSVPEITSYWGTSYWVNGSSGYWPTRYWDGGYYGPTYAAAPYWDVTEVRQKVLVIDLIDANTNKLVWRSIARAGNKDFRKPEVVEKTVDKALEHFPG